MKSLQDKQPLITTARQCKGSTKSGAACRVAPLVESDYCFTHDPATAGERKAARSKGGAARHGRLIGTAGAVEPVNVKSTADIVRLLEQAINDCFAMENSLNRSRTIGYLAGVACKALELDELADRVAALESVLKARDTK
jgi:hypothetical protein